MLLSIDLAQCIVEISLPSGVLPMVALERH